MKIINGFTYSKEPFEGWLYRVKFEFNLIDRKQPFKGDIFNNLDIYTDCVNIEEIYNSVSNNINVENVRDIKIIHWSSKEQDELIVKFIEETLKDF